MQKQTIALIFGVSLPLLVGGGYLLSQGNISGNKTSPNNNNNTNDNFRLAVNKATNASILTQTAKSNSQWQQVTNDWQEAIALMQAVPTSFPKYNIAQAKVVEYQKKLQYANERLGEFTKNIASNTPFRDAVNKANNAGILTQKAKSEAEWQQIVNDWQEAIALMKVVPNSFERYQVAQKKVKEYQVYLNYAVTRLNMAKKDNKSQPLVAAKPSPIPDKKEEPKNTITPEKPSKPAEKTGELTPKSAVGEMALTKVISGKITPKSVVYSGVGLFFAQNMMYSHTITVYDREYNLVKTIPDKIDLSKYGYKEFTGEYQGSPVEAAFSHNGKYAWISNYQMYGKGFNNPGSDSCSPSGHDRSFVYKVNTQSLEIENVIKVGPVPKFVGVTPDNKLVLVSNWCGWDLSVIDSEKNQEIKRVKLGAYPRGIVVEKNSQNAYVAVMGSSDIAKVNLTDFSVHWLRNIGAAPRHLNIDPENKYLYVTLNNEGNVAKIDLSTQKVVKKVSTGAAPRSMTISNDGQFLYVVNYNSNTVSKVRTTDMAVMKTVRVNANPIGITYDPEKKQVWVACYSGSLMVLQE